MDVKEEEVVVVKPTKKVYTKRKADVLQTLEKQKVDVVTEKETEKFTEAETKEDTKEESDDDEEPKSKRIKITRDKEPEPPQPSFLRGMVAKPILLALVSAVSFYINSVYQTTHRPPPLTSPGVLKKKTSPHELQTTNPLFSNTLPSSSVVIPGFTTKRK